jgi:fatty acid/phospholipid biosynthesis enzyme
MGAISPEAVVKGAALALRSRGFRCLSWATAPDRPLLARHDHPRSRVEIVHADEAIAMGEAPKEAVLRKPRASILVAAEMLGHDAADALVSAGNTGALVLACGRHIPLVPGTSRAGLAALIPARRRDAEDIGFVLLIDVGATSTPRRSSSPTSPPSARRTCARRSASPPRAWPSSISARRPRRATRCCGRLTRYSPA